MNGIAALFAASLAVVAAPGATAQVVSDVEFDFATLHAPGWELTATTFVNWSDGPGTRYPNVERVECRGESLQFFFSMDGTGDIRWLRARFLGNAGKDGARDEITAMGDHLWLHIDGERWEFANIPVHSNTFANVRYPPPASDIITGGWRGYQAVRRSASEPWLNLKLFYDRLIGAKRIEWSYKSRDWSVIDRSIAANALPKNWRTARYRIDTGGLRDAIFWCAREVVSEDAYLLPVAIRDNPGGGGD